MSTLVTMMQARALATALAGAVSSSTPVTVVVDAAVVDREALAVRVLEGTEALAARLARDSTAASIVITGELLDFRVHLMVPTTTKRTWSSRCPCTHTELVAHVQDRLAQAVEVVPTVEAAIEAPSEAPSENRSRPPTIEPSLATAAPIASRSQGLGRPGRWGVAFLGLGGLGLGAGTAIVAITPRIYDETFRFDANLRTQGIAAIAVGSSVLVSGVVLLVLDHRRRRARQENHR